MKSGKSGGIYSKLQVTRESMTVLLRSLLRIDPDVYHCKLQVIPTVPFLILFVLIILYSLQL